MSMEYIPTTTITANRVILIGQLDSMRVRDYDGKREKLPDGTTKYEYKQVMYQERYTPSLGGLYHEISIQVLSPYGGVFGLRLPISPRVRGSELLRSADPGTVLAFEGYLQFKKSFDSRFAQTMPDADGRLDRGLQTRALQFQVTCIREVEEAEYDATSAVWLEGVVAEPPRVFRHPEQPTIQLASTVVQIAYTRAASFPGLVATVPDNIEVNITIPTSLADGERCYRVGNRVQIVGQLDCYVEGRGGETVQAKLAALDAEWAAKQKELAGKPKPLANAERTYRKTRMQLEDRAQLSVLAGAVTLLEGTPQTLSESYAERRAFVRQRRTQTAARRERRERDQARRAGGSATDAGPVGFVEVVEAAVATVSPASVPVVEALPPRQQRPRRRESEASSGTEQRSGAAHVDVLAGDTGLVAVEVISSSGVEDQGAGTEDSGEMTLVVVGSDGDDAGEG